MKDKPMDPLREQVVKALRGTDTQHPLRVAITALLAESVTLETGATAAASLTPEARQFQAGRLASALDLRDLWAEMGEEARKEA
jgi:hypothetical protein